MNLWTPCLRMKADWLFLFTGCLLFSISGNALAQSGKGWKIELSDNDGKMHQLNRFIFRNDSLLISARSDYGRSNVDYLRRKLTKTERRTIEKFIVAFPADSLQKDYFNEYNNFTFIDADHAPRVLEVEIGKKGNIFSSKSVNAWVRLYDLLIQNINPYLPDEVRIKYERDTFNAFFQ